MKLYRAVGIYILIISTIACQPKEKEAPLLAHYIPEAPVKIDTSLVEIPFKLDFPVLDDEYRTEKQTHIESFYNTYIGSSIFSGSFLVAKNGVILFEKYQGMANVKDKSPVTRNTSMHVASVSKVLTATAILRLVQDGKLDLEQNIEEILPGFPYPETTIKTLLNHRSGLQHYSRFGEIIKGWNHRKTLTNQDVLDYLVKYKIKRIYRHDTRFNYCNTNYAMLALVIEKITEKPFPEAMVDLVFDPLEMDDTFVIDFLNQKDIVCQSYKSNNINYGWDQFDAIYGDKNVYSTPRDLLKFDMATYSEDFLRSDILQEALKGYSYEQTGINNYGLGIRMKEFPDGKTVHYHNGWWHGNTSSYITLKKDTVTIISLSNRYSKRPYQSMNLASLFGDYPFELKLKTMTTGK